MTVTNVTGDSTSRGNKLRDHETNPDAHHPQLHDVVSHSDVMGVASQNEILRRDGANYVPDRRTKAHIQLTQPLDGDSLIGDLWVLR